jgi:hypothetical protein
MRYETLCVIARDACIADVSLTLSPVVDALTLR